MARKPAAKKSSPKRPDPRQAAIDAAMNLAAVQGWRETTLHDIAAEAKISLAELYGVFPSKVSLVIAILRDADAAVLRGTDDFKDEPVRDRLFDLIMRRFDALQPHKHGLRAVIRDASRDPMQAACLSCALRRSLKWMLEAAGLPSSGLLGLARIKGLGAVYLATLRVWLNDDSEDLGTTMAALDRNLKRAEQLANLMPGRRRRDRAEPEAA
jgi:AcrR family transcriptional regulator